jgi:hypothetical protein
MVGRREPRTEISADSTWTHDRYFHGDLPATAAIMA